MYNDIFYHEIIIAVVGNFLFSFFLWLMWEFLSFKD
jgi:hypothetical protein